MKKYYYAENDNQIGPVSFEDLKSKNISKKTLVWFEGLEDWKSAEEIDELKELFKSIPPPLKTNTPPPFQEPTKNKSISEKKKTSSNRSVFIIIGIAVLLVSYLVYQNYSSSRNNNNEYQTSGFTEESSEMNYQEESYEEPKPKTEEELREELYTKEQRKPKDYLSVTYELDYRIFSGKDEIRGEIYNSASVATFKDVVLTVTYSTNTGTVLDTEEFVVYEYVYPGSSTSFRIKTFSPDGTKTIGVKVKSALAE